MTLMVTKLPPVTLRQSLWVMLTRPYAEVMLTPTGAKKRINQFKAFARTTRVTRQIIETAYRAAGMAAQQQAAKGQLPFLVSASVGPTFTSQGLAVETKPLGYQRSVATEQVCCWLLLVALFGSTPFKPFQVATCVHMI